MVLLQITNTSILSESLYFHYIFFILIHKNVQQFRLMLSVGNLDSNLVHSLPLVAHHMEWSRHLSPTMMLNVLAQNLI